MNNKRSITTSLYFDQPDEWLDTLKMVIYSFFNMYQYDTFFKVDTNIQFP